MNLDRIHATLTIVALTLVTVAALKISGSLTPVHRRAHAEPPPSPVTLILPAPMAAVAEIVPDIGASSRPKAARHGVGIVARSDGMIVTAAEVVGDARLVHVRLSYGRRYVGRVYRDESSRLAVVTVDSNSLWPCSFSPASAEQDSPLKGRAEVANARTAWTSSARTLPAPGTPVVDRYGRVSGMVVSQAHMREGAHKQPLVVPASLITAAIRRAETGAAKDRVPGVSSAMGWPIKIGIQVKECSPDNLGDYGLPLTSTGAIVVGLFPACPAERGGVQIGDVLVSIGGRRVERADNVAGLIRALPPGRDAGVIVDRQGRRVMLPVITGGPRLLQARVQPDRRGES